MRLSYYSSILFNAGVAVVLLWYAVAAQAAPDINCSSRESLDSRYARGILFVNVYDIGVMHCFLTGSIHRPDEDTEKQFTKNTQNMGHRAGKPSRMSIFLSARKQADDGVIVTGSGMVHELPQDLENGLLHAPHRVHTGVVPHFQILTEMHTSNNPKLTPDTKAADRPGPLVTQTSRTRPFYMEAKLPNANPFLLRVRRWARGCFFSPELIPELPPWEEVLAPQKGASNTSNTAAEETPMVVLGIVSCPNVLPGEAVKLTAQIVEHVQYHVSLGLAGVLMYVRNNLIGDLVQNENLQQLVRSKKLFLIKWDEFAAHSTEDAQSHDWHLQRAHAILAHSGITSSNVRLLFLDANEFLILPGDGGCMHSSDHNKTAQVVLNAWDVSITVPEGTGTSVFSAESLKTGQIQRACATCKPGTTMVSPDATFGVHLADALSIEGEAHRNIPEACAFIGRVSGLPGTADSSFERSAKSKDDYSIMPTVDGLSTKAATVEESQVQKLWTTGIDWALETMSKSAAR